MAAIAFLFAMCGGGGAVSACPTPIPGSDQDAQLQRVRAGAAFTVLYPCYMPNGQRLVKGTVSGTAGRQQTELVYEGPFNLSIRQAQFAPVIPEDPAGASRSLIDLFPNVRATLIEVNDGSGDALYHLFWERDGLFYEMQAYGPPLQRRTVLQVARSLQ